MTPEAILEELKSTKFTDFAKGINHAVNYLKESEFEARLFERVLTVFTYQLDYKHEEITQAYDKIGRNFQVFFTIQKGEDKLKSDLFSQGQMAGLSTFLTHFREGKLDLSSYFMVTGFSFQIAAQSCKLGLDVIDPSEYADECEALKLFYTVFDELWKIQMSVQTLIQHLTNWDNYSLIHYFNETLERADLESQSRMMAALSAHPNHPDIQQDIVLPYLKALDREIKKLEAEKTQTEALKAKIAEWFPEK